MTIPAKKKVALSLKLGENPSGTSQPSSDERRVQPRFTTQFRSTFSGSHEEGNGKTLDVSIGGCKIESDATVAPGAKFECRLHVPDLDWPIMIDEATIRWVEGKTFGVAFTRIRPGEKSKISALIGKLKQE